ncbi:hypothetical protein ACE6H2_000978 [Prunus campanulata]
MQHLMGIERVIVDLVQEITEAVSNMIKPTTDKDGGEGGQESVGRRREDADAGEIKARVLAEGAFFSFEADSRVDTVLHKLHCSFGNYNWIFALSLAFNLTNLKSRGYPDEELGGQEKSITTQE